MTKTKTTQNFTQRIKALSRNQKRILWAAGIVIVYTLVGFFVLPPAVELALEKKLPEVLHRQVTIDKIRFNPYTLTVSVEGFKLQQIDTTGDLFAFERVFVDLQTASLLKMALIIKSVTLTNPKINFSRNKDKAFSFADLVSKKTKKTIPPEDSKPFLFSINNITITNGTIDFHDTFTDKHNRIAELNLSVPSISNLDYEIEKYVQPSFSADINNSKFAMGGKTKPFAQSRETSAQIKISDINIPEYLRYIPIKSKLTLKSAFLDIDARLLYLERPDTPPKLSLTGLLSFKDIDVVDLQAKSYVRLPDARITIADSNLLEKKVNLADITLTNFIVQDPADQTEIIKVPLFTVLDTELALEEKELIIGAVQSQKAELTIVKGKNGTINLSKIFRSEKKPQTPISKPDPENTEGERETKSWSIKLKTAAFDQYSIIFKDKTPRVPAITKIDNFVIDLANISNEKNSMGNLKFQLKLNRTGRIIGKGMVGIAPFSSEMALDLKNIEIKKFSPYITEQLNIVLENGTIAAKGKIKLQQADGPRIVFGFNGNCQASDLATRDALLKKELLSWKNLAFNDIRFSSHPQSLKIKDISLERPYTKLIITESGTLNFATLKQTTYAATNSPKTSGAKKDKQVGDIRIDNIKIKNGKIDFLDQKIKPDYSAHLAGINGSLSNLSSLDQAMAKVEITGKFNQHSPLKISGKMNPLKEKIYADFILAFQDIDLSPISPYTGKFIGYKTDKGKLTLNLHHIIDDKKVDAKNHIFLDQFTLGKTVDNPDAANLPVSLAISLLKNRDGEIKLDIPVKGDLNDPEFSVGEVVFNVILNLIAKAATSPFALLGALIPDGKDLQFVAFHPGLSELTEDARANLSKMARIMYERPGLRMDIIGKVDPHKDREALTQMRFKQLLKTQKMQDKGLKENSLSKSTELTEEQYPFYLAKAFEALKLKEIKEDKESGFLDTIKKKRLLKKQVKRVQSETDKLNEKRVSLIQRMELKLRQQIQVSDDDLRLLAIERTNQALAFLVEKGPIKPERLFVIEPQIPLAKGTSGNQAKMQVEMVIK